MNSISGLETGPGWFDGFLLSQERQGCSVGWETLRLRTQGVYYFGFSAC